MSPFPHFKTLRSNFLRSNSLRCKALAAVLWLCALPATAQAPATAQVPGPFKPRILSYFAALSDMPKEKAYVHIDKPLYNAGDSLWFRGYLVNGMLYNKPAVSNFLYVELLNSADSLILRKKIKRDTLGGFANALPLPAKLAEGEYNLRAWSTWMQNRPQDYFFERKIYITNSLNMTLDLARSEVQADQEESKARPGRRSKVQAEPVRAFAADFFPEGGPLLQDVMQKVAFRIIGADGLPLEAQGVLVCTDSLAHRVDTLSRIRTEHDGMGQLILSARAGCAYRALLRTHTGLEGQFDLPPVQAQGITLALSQHNNKIRYQIQRTPGLEFTDSLYLLVQSRGLLLNMLPLAPNAPGGVLDGNRLPEGVIHFLLVAQNHNTPLAERLLLVQHPQLQTWIHNAPALSHQARERVELCLSLNKNLADKVSRGSFSVSVTNSELVEPDTTAANIRSSLLLDSELQGALFNPGYYVGNGDDPGRAFHTDLLLLCHGWRKYADFDFSAAKPAPDTLFYMEQGQFIDGYTENLFGKPITEGELIAFSAKPFIMTTTPLDSKGQFVFDNLSFPDSTTFVIRAKNKRGKSNMTLVANEQVFPLNTPKTPFRGNDPAVAAAFLQQSKEKYYLDGGLPTYNIQEIAVTAEASKSESSSMYADMADQSYSGEKLAVFDAQNVLEMLKQMAWMEVTEERISIRGSQGMPLLLIDDIPYTGDDLLGELERMSMTNVESVDIFRGANAVIFGDGASNGVINIMLKSATIANDDSRALGVINFSPLGYAKPVAFYHPRYETPEALKATRTDLRTTVFWTPYAVPDAQGNIPLDFYLPDNPGKLRVEIEGIDAGGTACRYCIDL